MSRDPPQVYVGRKALIRFPVILISPASCINKPKTNNVIAYLRCCDCADSLPANRVDHLASKSMFNVLCLYFGQKSNVFSDTVWSNLILSCKLKARSTTTYSQSYP